MKRPISIKYSIVIVLVIFFLEGVVSFIDNPKLEKEILTEFENLILGDFEENTSTSSAIVKRVIDADTVELESGQKVRYIGIDSPETKHPTKSVECFGQEASLKNKELVEGKQVILQKDVSEVDRYGRLLRYVYVNSENEEKIFVNEFMVKEGYAKVSTFPPDIKYQDVFLEAESLARQENKGLWGFNCDT